MHEVLDIQIDERCREAMVKESPHKTLAEWAKSSCNRCYGTARVRFRPYGELEFKSLICSCAENRFRRWLVDWLAKYRLERSKESELLVGTDGQPLKVEP